MDLRSQLNATGNNPRDVILLDPRPDYLPKMESLLKEVCVIGAEVTTKELASLCEINIDPQHTGGNSNVASIEEASSIDLPDMHLSDIVLVTVRPDADAFGALAIVKMRYNDIEITEEMKERIDIIANQDKFVKGEWTGYPLPTKENPFPEQTDGENILMFINSYIKDRNIKPLERLLAMEEFIRFGKNPNVSVDPLGVRLQLIKAYDDDELQVEIISITDELEFVEVLSRTQGGTIYGYALSPVVLMVNDKFTTEANKEPHLKYTISQYANGYIDMKSLLEKLNELEPGWGGSLTIIGSPQGVGSTLSLETVREVLMDVLEV